MKAKLKQQSPVARLIETDEFPFEFVSQLAERESWRKEVHRPIYHVHKWWAKRLGSVFRGVLLGCVLPEDADLSAEFYRNHDFSQVVAFDPFMGSGTTIGEAHKLGMTAWGRDINPVATQAVLTALGPMSRKQLQTAFDELSSSVGTKIRKLYGALDNRGHECDVLYFFWVMQAQCPECRQLVDLFPTYVIARNAYPDRKPEVQIICPQCGDIFPGKLSDESAECRKCKHRFGPHCGPAQGAKATCTGCRASFAIVDAVRRQGARPQYRLYGKLVLTKQGRKEYLPVASDDRDRLEDCSLALRRGVDDRSIILPDLPLQMGHNTRQAMNYGFHNWRDFFNDRQLLALSALHSAITNIEDEATRRALLTLFSGVLEFNNLFASYKGEGTGAVRHMFSHHILKPERLSIEANPWGTPKSSGSFLNLFRSRLLRALDYRESPTETTQASPARRACSDPICGNATMHWPPTLPPAARSISLSCGDSAVSELADQSVDLVVTDPPFFDNVHYSELADFFFAWQRLDGRNSRSAVASTRQLTEVQDSDPGRFAAKLARVLCECNRVLKPEGLLVFSYHHSREEGWSSVAEALWNAGFVVVNCQPVKAEMSVATPKSQAKEPIQLDIILVCRKRDAANDFFRAAPQEALARAHRKIARLAAQGFALSRNDRKVVLFGQLLTAVTAPSEITSLASLVEQELCRPVPAQRILRDRQQQLLSFQRD